MDFLNSPWFINRLENSSKQPRERILNLFDLIEHKDSLIDFKAQGTHAASQTLIEYLTLQAKELGATNPSILAEHIVLIARSAASQANNEPSSDHLAHAKKAAEALILAQTQHEPTYRNYKRTTLYGMAASLMILLGLSAILLPNILSKAPTASAENHVETATSSTTASKEDNNKLTAQDAVAMYAQFDQMRTGTCQFPEAIQIPDQDKAVYLESVVGGKLPTNLTDLATANKYLAKVRCNYTPMLMAKSK
jgi:hypothetical protein